MQERLIRKRELEAITGYDYSTIFRKERRGEFPARVQVGPNRVAWKFTEVMEWIASRPLAVKPTASATSEAA